MKRSYYSSESSASTTGSGLSLSTVVFVVFLVLKLTNNIDWSWWWVTSPLWIPLSLLLVFLIVYYFIKASYNAFGLMSGSKIFIGIIFGLLVLLLTALIISTIV